jgi:hypothetical protein
MRLTLSPGVFCAYAVCFQMVDQVSAAGEDESPVADPMDQFTDSLGLSPDITARWTHEVAPLLRPERAVISFC